MHAPTGASSTWGGAQGTREIELGGSKTGGAEGLGEARGGVGRQSLVEAGQLVLVALQLAFGAVILEAKASEFRQSGTKRNVLKQ